MTVSCSIKQSKDSSSVENKKIVLTTFTILADMARNVAGERLIIKSITKPGAEIHGYQFTPSDLLKAQDANLIIANGLGLERWMDKFTSNVGNIPRVELTKGMKPLLIDGDIYSGKPNPHAWMSPKRSINYVENLLKAFIQIDPEGEKEFTKNAENYISKLRALDSELRESLSVIPEEQRLLVTCEGAFTYLTNDYGMGEAYLWPVNAESQVTPKRVVDLISKINNSQVPTIFCESTVSSKAQLQVAKSTGTRFGGTFYVDSLSSRNGPAPSLLELQRHNARLIIEGLSSKP